MSEHEEYPIDMVHIRQGERLWMRLIGLTLVAFGLLCVIAWVAVGQ